MKILICFVILLYSRISFGDPRTSLGINHANRPNLCHTAVCKNEAAYILANMDQNINPCENFYEFACGGYLKSKTIPNGTNEISYQTDFEDKIDEQIKVLLNQQMQNDEPKAFVQAKNFFASCVNREQIEKMGLKPAKRLVKKLGSSTLYMGKKWNPDKFKWAKSVRIMRKIGLPAGIFLDVSIVPDNENPNLRIIKIGEPDLGFNPDSLVKGIQQADVKLYHNYQIESAVAFGAKKEVVGREMHDVLEFQMLLARTLANTSTSMKTKELFKLQRKFPFISWMEFISSFLPSDIQISDEEFILVEVSEFIGALRTILANTPKRVQANYVIWRSLEAMAKALPEGAFQFKTNFYKETDLEPRWRHCVKAIRSSELSYAVASMYVRSYFPENLKEIAVEISDNVVDVYKELIKENMWMEENTKTVALEKLNVMDAHIGYQDEYLNDTVLNTFYESYKMKPESYFDNTLQLHKMREDFQFGNLRRRKDDNRWLSLVSPENAIAITSLNHNSFIIPAGLLQGIVFNEERPSYMNYAVAGWLIGHEISYGFDEEGRNHDENGNGNDWWDEDTENAYMKRSECFVKQYSKYMVGQIGFKVDGKNTKAENIADNNGLLAAYRGYQIWLKENGPEKGLHGMDYSSEQLFWISAASSLCSKTRTDVLMEMVLYGTQTPNEFRVKGAFSNMREFAKDFGCSAGSKYNPVKKCSIYNNNK